MKNLAISYLALFLWAYFVYDTILFPHKKELFTERTLTYLLLAVVIYHQTNITPFPNLGCLLLGMAIITISPESKSHLVLGTALLFLAMYLKTEIITSSGFGYNQPPINSSYLNTQPGILSTPQLTSHVPPRTFIPYPQTSNNY